jgi:hypothetical protein
MISKVSHCWEAMAPRIILDKKRRQVATGTLDSVGFTKGDALRRLTDGQIFPAHRVFFAQAIA